MFAIQINRDSIGFYESENELMITYGPVKYAKRFASKADAQKKLDELQIHWQQRIADGKLGPVCAELIEVSGQQQIRQTAA